jgi:two-component system sensor histidine kinase/response regulator
MSAGPGATRHILVVEDSPTQATALEALLESHGYAVSVARSGEAALTQLERDTFDLVVSDVMMPGMSGYDLSRAMKESAALRRTPIVLLTSLADPLDIVRGLESGADNYVTKPYESHQLVARIERVFENLALRRDRARTGPVDITFLGTHFTITSEKEQILDLLVSSFEDLVRTNAALREAEAGRARLHELETSARVEAEEARRIAEEANRAKSEFLAMMSHDLRTPLNAIGGYADLLALGIRGPVTEQQVADLDRIKRNQRHLLALVNDVLSFARIERGDLPLVLVPTPLNKTIRPLGAMVEPQTRTKKQTYRYAACDDSLVVLADAERVGQIVVNLLGNSVKFTPDGGSITLCCGLDPTQPGMARIQVRDNGIGIPEDKLQSIFEPFTQLDARHAGRDGVGLGLAISRKLTRLMGGDIVAESVPGQGTVLTVSLPLA